MKNRQLSTPLLSTSSFYPKPEITFKQTFSTPGSTMGIALIGVILLYMSWRYQKTSYKKIYKIDDTNQNAWETKNQMLEVQRQQELNLRDMQSYYYYNNLHPQQKLNQILHQNNAHELENFIDESIIERYAGPKPTII